MDSLVLVEKKDHIAIVKVNRPKALNALSTEVCLALGNTFQELDKNHDIYCVILTGSPRTDKEGNIVIKKQSFVAGADIAQMSTMDAEQGKEFGNVCNAAFMKIENYKKPVIAAINGYCLGGGVELALSCDLRICSENATFGLPETGLGIIPGIGGTQRLARTIGVGKAKEMIYTASKGFTSQDALQCGLVNYVVPYKELMDKAMELAQKIAQNAPIALSFAKEAINTGMQMDIHSATRFESNCFGHCFATKDQKQAMGDFVNKVVPPRPFQNK
jgi:enoyl-CoA hydratase